MNKPKFITVTSIGHLKALTKDGPKEFRMLLNYGAFSRKSIEYNSKRNEFRVFNWIDDSSETLSEKRLNDSNYTLIGKAIVNSALIMEEE